METNLNIHDELISFDTAILAKEMGFDNESQYAYNSITEEEYIRTTPFTNKDKDIVIRPTQSLLQKFIREKRGVHIEIHRNASGYYWSMCKEDGGTDLGWSDHSGPNLGGVWDSFEDALENALQAQLSYDLPNNTKIIKHWGNYVEFALKSIE